MDRSMDFGAKQTAEAFDAGEPAPASHHNAERPGRTAAAVEVLGPQGQFIAAFISVLEAFRYATLVREPGFTPKLRRVADGQVIELSADLRMAELGRWTEAAAKRG